MRIWVGIVLVALLVFCTGCGKSSQELSMLGDQAMKKGNYASAVAYFKDGVSRASDNVEQKKIQKKLDTAMILQASKESYNNAKSALATKKYVSAFTAFSAVSATSEYCEEAKKGKALCAKIGTEEAMQKATTAYKNGDITQAISILRDAKPFNSPDVKQLLEAYKRAQASQLIRKANHLRAQDDYSGAISALSQAQELGSKEAERLRSQYEEAQARYEQEQREQEERAQLKADKEQARYYEGDGSVQIAVGSVRLQRSTEQHTAGKNATYVCVAISAKNAGDDIVHVNPNDFTLATQDGETASHDTETYSMSNYFDAVDLRPGQSTSGWLMFYMRKDNRYTLGYQGFGGSAEKMVIP